MIEQLKIFLGSLKSNPRVSNFDEAATKQAIVLPLLHMLGWNTYNIDEVTPEFSVENRRVDYSLRLNNINEVFLEVKKTDEDLNKHQEQLLDYSFRQGVELAILTNGITWWFYLPTKKGDWKTRKFYTIDIIQQESPDIAQKFIDLLSEITEKLCGFKPEMDEVTQFLKHYEGQFLLLPEEDFSIIKPIKPRVASPAIPEGKKITQDDLIPYIIKILQKHDGRARKDQVEEEIYQLLKDIFKEPRYQETVSSGVPRWQHFIAWAKERAKRKGLIKRPDDSGRGYWELTVSGMKIN